ncbi:unnamed protein product [Schistosoma margrebowiei]|uniref:Uncharacterized protein n=1 Tax=Schistosoma margrebowiei TaxID=48269 RepID=A0A183MW98_9TREM|nr:unnamed protein product [Schistosoma margrebowiei]
MRQLYDTMEKLAGKDSKTERPVKDKEGRPITETQKRRNIWVEYVEELLNRLPPSNPANIEAAPTEIPTYVIPSKTEAISKVIG